MEQEKKSKKLKLTDEQIDEVLKKEKNSKLQDFEIIRNIGEGNFSVVKIVEHIKYKKKYALKVVNLFRLHQKKKEADVLMEKDSLLKLYGEPGIIKLVTTFKDQHNLYFLMEFCYGGELWEISHGYGLIYDGLARFYFKQVCETVQRIHSHKIAHRDLKNQNILLHKNLDKIKIIDFGSSKDMESDEIRSKMGEKEKKFKNYVGTPEYMAPECINNKNSSPSSDIWSLGCVLYQMYAGMTPFKRETDYLTYKAAIDQELQFPSQESIVPQDIKELIKSMMRKNEEDRPTIEEVLKSEVFSKVSGDEISILPSTVDISLRILTQDLQKRENVYKFDGEKSVHEAFEMLRAEVKKAEYEQALSLEKIEYFEQRAIDKIFYDKN